VVLEDSKDIKFSNSEGIKFEILRRYEVYSNKKKLFTKDYKIILKN